MTRSSLAPVFARLRIALHVLVVGLVAFVIGREWTQPGHWPVAVVVLAAAFLATYAAGAMPPRSFSVAGIRLTSVWLALLTVEALALSVLSPDAAYLVFPLFVLYLHLLPGWWGAAAVTACVWLGIVAAAIAGRLTTGGVIGPLVAAAVAIVAGLGYRTLYRETVERQRLIAELLATRQELLEKEREAGVLSERARLAREIHDTVAQGLASIQLLLHAAERADAERPGIEHIRLARETAAANLEETRRIIRALSPAALDDQTLARALERLAASTRRTTAAGLVAGSGADDGLVIDVRVSGEAVPLPTPIETALLRVAQGALANVVQHAKASRVTMTLTYMEDAVSLDIVDNGCGFDPEAVGPGRLGSQSFGLAGMESRIAQLGGEFTLESAPAAGAALAVRFGLRA